MSPQESLFITYAKALGIICVLIGHLSWSPMLVYNPYIFHMPLFFLIGGLLQKPILNYKTFRKNTFERYVWYIIFWYVLIGFISLGLNYFLGLTLTISFGQEAWYTYLSYPIQVHFSNNGLFLVAWFLFAYFLVTTVFRIQITILEQKIKKDKLQKGILVFGIGLAWFAVAILAPLYVRDNSYWYYNLSCQFCVGYLFMAVGYFMQTRLANFASLPFFLLSILIMCSLIGDGTIQRMSMSTSDYPSWFWRHFLGAFLGCYALCFLAMIFSQLKPFKMLMLVGQHSKDIMTLHLVGFVKLDLLFSYLGYFDKTGIQALDHYARPLFWAVYIVFGLIYPILVRMGARKLGVKLP